ncbi:hypothetical protein NSK_005751 [Nannochloropsis salina CCMP1776]|uniref:Transmembrane protein n=1 Tax=Nannochloropsis salina CCMP1776 TaxID=1027361 RepID=A0A4D9CVH2_9STRA|nr:hypothetical protein NSK_005751 [Nannochloropsis salina CCMP1776]|eukprot:TFJ82926.1 hypothetical protein NSK_005751 [Nannochloropsis salina CCMP1776]
MGSNAKRKTSSSFLGNVLTPSFYLVLLTALTTSYHYLSSHHAEVDSYLGGPRVRSFENFETFYKRVYREQHANDHNRYLHFFGTTLVLAYAASEPLLLVAATMAVVVGLNVYELTYMFKHGALEGAAMLLTYLVLSRALLRSLSQPLLPLLLGYGCAWVGHFFLEGNKPATFTYAVFSFMGDFRMWWEIVGELGRRMLG